MGGGDEAVSGVGGGLNGRPYDDVVAPKTIRLMRPARTFFA
jgi:hypothetical protein